MDCDQNAEQASLPRARMRDLPAWSGRTSHALLRPSRPSSHSPDHGVSRQQNFRVRTSQGEPGVVEVPRRVWTQQDTAHSSVPGATDGCLHDLADDRTRIEDGPQSPRGSAIQVETFCGPVPRDANVGPGMSAIIDNRTD